MRAREGGREGGKEGGRGTPSSGVEWVRARLAHLHMYLKRMVMKREGRRGGASETSEGGRGPGIRGEGQGRVMGVEEG